MQGLFGHDGAGKGGIKSECEAYSDRLPQEKGESSPNAGSIRTSPAGKGRIKSECEAYSDTMEQEKGESSPNEGSIRTSPAGKEGSEVRMRGLFGQNATGKGGTKSECEAYSDSMEQEKGESSPNEGSIRTSPAGKEGSEVRMRGLFGQNATGKGGVKSECDACAGKSQERA